MYTFGSNEYGKLGLGHENKVSAPTKVQSVGICVAVACGRNHTLAANADGKLLSCGCNGEGQLGTGNTEDTLTMTECDLKSYKKGWQSVACGAEHSAALTCDGVAFTWGDNSNGQLGTTKENKKPVKLKIKGRISLLACGYYHTAIATVKGDLYMFGQNESGELGLGPKVFGLEKNCKPAIAQGLVGKVLAVACGADHTIVVTEDGVFGSGRNDKGQLGLQQEVEFTKIFSPLSAFATDLTSPPEKIRKIFRNFDSNGDGTINAKEMAKAIRKIKPDASDAEIDRMVADNDADGGSTLDLNEFYRSVKKASGLSVGIDVACGAAHSFIMTDNGDALSFGDGHHGRLGLSNHDTTFVPTKVVSSDFCVTELACGGTQSLLIGHPLNQHDSLPIVLKVTYSIYVTTGKDKNGGADTKISVMLFGSNGNSEELHLKKSKSGKDPFEPGNTDCFEFAGMKNFGTIKKIRVTSDGKKHGFSHFRGHKDWNLDRIKVCPSSADDVEFLFKCKQWFSKDEGLSHDFKVTKTTGDDLARGASNAKSLKHKEIPDDQSDDSVTDGSASDTGVVVNQKVLDNQKSSSNKIAPKEGNIERPEVKPRPESDSEAEAAAEVELVSNDSSALSKPPMFDGDVKNDVDSLTASRQVEKSKPETSVSKDFKHKQKKEKKKKKQHEEGRKKMAPESKLPQHEATIKEALSPLPSKAVVSETAIPSTSRKEDSKHLSTVQPGQHILAAGEISSPSTPHAPGGQTVSPDKTINLPPLQIVEELDTPVVIRRRPGPSPSPRNSVVRQTWRQSRITSPAPGNGLPTHGLPTLSLPQTPKRTEHTPFPTKSDDLKVTELAEPPQSFSFDSDEEFYSTSSDSYSSSFSSSEGSETESHAEFSSPQQHATLSILPGEKVSVSKNALNSKSVSVPTDVVETIPDRSPVAGSRLSSDSSSDSTSSSSGETDSESPETHSSGGSHSEQETLTENFKEKRQALSKADKPKESKVVNLTKSKLSNSFVVKEEGNAATNETEAEAAAGAKQDKRFLNAKNGLEDKAAREISVPNSNQDSEETQKNSKETIRKTTKAAKEAYDTQKGKQDKQKNEDDSDRDVTSSTDEQMQISTQEQLKNKKVASKSSDNDTSNDDDRKFLKTSAKNEEVQAKKVKRERRGVSRLDQDDDSTGSEAGTATSKEHKPSNKAGKSLKTHTKKGKHDGDSDSDDVVENNTLSRKSSSKCETDDDSDRDDADKKQGKSTKV